jgi:hypothetical protein
LVSGVTIHTKEEKNKQNKSGRNRRGNPFFNDSFWKNEKPKIPTSQIVRPFLYFIINFHKTNVRLDFCKFGRAQSNA